MFLQMIFIFVFLISPTDNHSVSQEENIQYYWIWTDTLATITIPSGFKEQKSEYGEGIVTILSYPDSSYIILHFGFTMSLPLLKSPEHLIYGTRSTPERTIRYGRLKHSRFRWREEHFNVLPMNIAFSNVNPKLLKTFEKAFSTFSVLKKF
jgi:hypothetical protein